MAKLPDKYNLSGPVSLRSGRAIASVDATAAGRGIAAVGDAISTIGADITQRQNTVDLPNAEAIKTEGFLNVENAFGEDPDYSTFQKRAPVRTTEVLENAAKTIRDPRMRERWLAGARVDAIRVNDSIADRGRVLRDQAEIARYDNSLETNRRLYVDPATSDDIKKKARADIEGAIEVGLSTGLLTPAMAEQRRKTFLEDADFSRGELAAATAPESIPGRRGPVADLISAKAAQYGVPADIAVGIAYIESGLNPNAKASTSSAGGLFQFIDSTASRYGLTNKMDPEANADAGARLTRDNISGLRRDLGREPTPGEVYLAHFSGFGAAQKLGRASADTPTSQIFSPQAIRANSSILRGKTAGQVRAWADQKMAVAMRKGGAGGDVPDWYTRLSPEQQFRLQKQSEAEQNKRNIETRAQIEIVTANAPTAILNTGRYDNPLPTAQQFMDAYGPMDGAQRFNAFQSEVDTASQAHEMRTMSADQIQQMVSDATPTSTGDNAALETQRYQTLSAAAQSTLKAREEDPGRYVRQMFPNIKQAWDNVSTGADYQAALALTAAAQQNLGISNMRLLPDDHAEAAVSKFKDATLPEAKRLETAMHLVMSTQDRTQQRAVFNQLVEAGLPDMTEGAFEAMARGDNGAAKRLFQAAMINPDDLPGKLPKTKEDISAQIQSDLMDEGEVGDVYYGLSDGNAENFARAERDNKLMMNAVILRMKNGEVLSDAIAGVSRDLYGDVKVVDGDGRVNARLLLPQDEDEDAVLDGLDAVMPDVRSAVEGALALPADLATADSTRPILDAVTRNYADNVLSEGFFRNYGDGFVFHDPYTGKPIPGPDGMPLVFTTDSVLAARPARDARTPSAPLTDDAFDRFQQRMSQ